ncbi:16S rRNA (uracil(1498)-N(3))-methyltransferase [Corynebacterium uberis]|uniref:16S rRNA (uracil(1498)-N(3))-methyltransferase n=1 Tax=Corynebacterium TaxID=1716 RepID=UPI001D0B0C53|nr:MULTISPECIES: 16S rRNA (uracil(1498)-N(3))-methyltransferase [Corynebacterium]MCZ9308203.1 16S rRNA (uracil(1498)-N(3))-methyltransferase [Corynebacterium sp. c6VSa_13]UDL73884.1 16S rRNA (uracil(1498)-N(3))-methyltransferase [Corynebacterium uberis]UDL75233.1 16S rRNA (uracil(1498)-N(3))-methyltransferase [Corynebacterium uberis]UDL77444.1 16S rRNA (uracil(1498)-N(3))-methyltransferase [Corynebacterium uberis]UDL79730.1 16S rRNA (uracil(1498)-N(3))-methyltransferase [Corynebacterium uberis
MSLPVFLAPPPLPALGEQAELSGPEARHAVTVKRVRAGEHIELIDAAGTRARVRVTATEGKDRLFGVVEHRTVEEPPTPTVTVIQALPKAERSELAVDLACQGGADEIIPWQAHRCVAKWSGPKQDKGRAKWQAAAVAAAKQARRARVPHIGEVLDTAGVARLLRDAGVGADAAGSPTTVALLLHEDPQVATRRFAQVDLSAARQIFLLVGPEGGIGAQEAAELVAAGAQCVRLGPEVLRTATAAMVALAAIGVTTGRW